MRWLKRNWLTVSAVILLLMSIAPMARPLPVGTTTITGTIQDSQGNPVNGTLTMQLPVAAQAPGNNVLVSPAPVTYSLVNGVVQPGPPLWDVTGLQPKNLFYIAKVYNSAGQLLFNGNYFVAGASFNLGSATPTSVTTSNISFINPVTTNVTNVFTAPQSFVQINDSNGTVAGSGWIRMQNTDLICWRNASNTGDICVTAPSVPGGAAGTLTLPGITDTLVGRTTTDTLTNKTIAGAAVTGAFTGTGAYIPVSLLNSGTGANNTTFWRGDGTWANPSTTPFPQTVFSTISAATGGNLGPITMATPSANADYRATFYVDVTAVGVGCNTVSQVALSVSWTDPLAAGATTSSNPGFTVNLTPTGGSFLGVVGPANGLFAQLGSVAGATAQLEPSLTFRAKSGQAITYSTTAIPSAGCTTNITYQVVPILEQMTAN